MNYEIWFKRFSQFIISVRLTDPFGLFGLIITPIHALFCEIYMSQKNKKRIIDHNAHMRNFDNMYTRKLLKCDIYLQSFI